MKCPKCGFVTFDYIDKCKRCGKPLPKIQQKPIFSFEKKEEKILTKKDKENTEAKASKEVIELTKKISPVPDIEPIAENYSEGEKLRKQFVPIISDNDDYNLITNQKAESFSLENLPLLSRFIAFLIDLLILSTINGILILLSLLVVKADINSLLIVRYYYLLLFLLIHYLYYVYFTVIFQATPGKMIMKLKTISLTNLKSTKLTFAQASWRWLTLMAGLCFFLLGIFYMLIDENHAALHDRLSLSLVIKERDFELIGNEL